MTKLKFGVTGVIAIASVVTPLLIQHHSLAQLHQENQDLRQQLTQLASVVHESEQPSNLLAKATAQTPNSDELKELLRLRGEVGRLRNEEKELARLRMESVKSPAKEQATSASAQTGLPEQRFIYVGGRGS
jgi:hypothetical protein